MPNVRFGHLETPVPSKVIGIFLVFEDDNGATPKDFYRMLSDWFKALPRNSIRKDGIELHAAIYTVTGSIGVADLHLWGDFFKSIVEYFGAFFFHIEVLGIKEKFTCDFDSDVAWHSSVSTVMNSLAGSLNLAYAEHLKIDVCVNVQVGEDNICWPSRAIENYLPKVCRYTPLFCRQMVNYHSNLVRIIVDQKSFRLDSGLVRVNFYSKYVERIKKFVGARLPPTFYNQSMSTCLLHSKLEVSKVCAAVGSMATNVVNARRFGHTYRREATTSPVLLWETVESLLDLVRSIDWYFVTFDDLQYKINSSICYFSESIIKAIDEKEYYNILFFESVLREIFIHGKGALSILLPTTVRLGVSALIGNGADAVQASDFIALIDSASPDEKLAACRGVLKRRRTYPQSAKELYNIACIDSVLQVHYKSIEKSYSVLVKQFIMDIQYSVGQEITGECVFLNSDNLRVENRRAITATNNYMGFNIYCAAILKFKRNLFCKNLNSMLMKRHKHTMHEGHALVKAASEFVDLEHHLVALIDDAYESERTGLLEKKRQVLLLFNKQPPSDDTSACKRKSLNYHDGFDVLLADGIALHGNVNALSKDYCLGLCLVGSLATIHNRIHALERPKNIDHYCSLLGRATHFKNVNWVWEDRLEFWQRYNYVPNPRAIPHLKELIEIDRALASIARKAHLSNSKVLCNPQKPFLYDISYSTITARDFIEAQDSINEVNSGNAIKAILGSKMRIDKFSSHEYAGTVFQNALFAYLNKNEPAAENSTTIRDWLLNEDTHDDILLSSELSACGDDFNASTRCMLPTSPQSLQYYDDTPIISSSERAVPEELQIKASSSSLEEELEVGGMTLMTETDASDIIELNLDIESDSIESITNTESKQMNIWSAMESTTLSSQKQIRAITPITIISQIYSSPIRLGPTTKASDACFEGFEECTYEPLSNENSIVYNDDQSYGEFDEYTCCAPLEISKMLQPNDDEDISKMSQPIANDCDDGFCVKPELDLLVDGRYTKNTCDLSAAKLRTKLLAYFCKPSNIGTIITAGKLRCSLFNHLYRPGVDAVHGTLRQLETEALLESSTKYVKGVSVIHYKRREIDLLKTRTCSIFEVSNMSFPVITSISSCQEVRTFHDKLLRTLRLNRIWEFFTLSQFRMSIASRERPGLAATRLLFKEMLSSMRIEKSPVRNGIQRYKIVAICCNICDDVNENQ